MQLRYTPQFNQSFDEIMNCGNSYYSQKTLLSLFNRLKEVKGLLLSNPKLGGIAHDISNVEFEYRKIVLYKYLKLIYFIIDDTIYFADIWDTRRDPSYTASRYL